MSSEPECTCPPDVVQRYEEAIAEIRRQVAQRSQVCEVIAIKARHFGLDVDAKFVNRHLDWFQRWDTGYIASGYLINRLGIKRLPRTQSRNGV